MTMLDDGVKAKGKEEDVEILDLAELLDRKSLTALADTIDPLSVLPGTALTPLRLERLR